MASTSKREWRLAAIGLVLAAATAWLAWEATPGGVAAEDEKPRRAALPADLERVPRDAVGFLSVPVADLWNSPLLKDVRPVLLREVPEMRSEMTKALGTPPENIERMTLVLPEISQRGEPVVLIATRKPYDRKTVLATLGDTAKTEIFFLRHTLHVSPNGRKALHLFDDSTYVLGDLQAIKEYLGFPRDRTQGPLSEALRQAGAKHALTLGVNGVAIARFLNRELSRANEELPPQVKPFLPLLKAHSAVAVLDLGEEARVEVRIRFDSDKSAAAGVKAVQAARQLAGVGLTQSIQGVERQEGMKNVVGLLRLMERALKAAKIEQKDATVVGIFSVPIEQKTITLMLMDSVQKTRQAAARVQSQNNLKQIGLAMHNCAQSNDYHLPPRAIYDKNGKPLLSWRVLILPYIEQDALYKEFHLDEPWDSAHNKKLLAQMPNVYAAAADPKAVKNHETHYQGFAGKGTVFEGKKGIRFPADIQDGTSNTILVVEAAKAVPWTKPEDIPFDDSKEPGKELLQKVGGLFLGGFNAAFCDGSVRFISKNVKPSTLRLLILRSNGMPLPADAP